MKIRWMTALLAAGVLGTVVPAGAAAGVTITGSTRTGDALRVTGGATFADQPFVTLAVDPGQDAPPGVEQLGGDLRSIGLSTTVNGDVKLRFTTSSMPAPLSGSPALAYAWTFCVGGSTCYELRMQRFTYGTDNGVPTAGDSALYRCATPSCASAGLTAVATGWIPIYFDGAGFTATVSSGVSMAPGTAVTGVNPDGNGAAISALGQADPATVQRGTGDGIASVAPYTVARQEVSVTVGAPGQDPSAVTYGTAVAPNGAGDWSATVDVAGLSGDHAIYARACLGEGNCTYATAPITL
jgi:hypothetical protein